MQISYTTPTGDTKFFTVPDFYLVKGEKKRLKEVTYERDLYGADTGYLGETILVFTDGSMELERRCLAIVD